MRKIYQKYLEVPEEDKGIMGERVFFARLTVAIACIVLCMSAMGFSAYAYFTASVSSNMNQIQAANFTVKPEIVVTQNSDGSASHEANTAWKYVLQPGMYDITLTKEGTASTGYCLIKIGENQFYTQQLGAVKDVNGNEIVTRTITIAVEKRDTAIEVTACWGTYSGNPLSISEVEEMIIVDEKGVAGIGGKLEFLTTKDVVASKESVSMQDNTAPTETTTEDDSVVSSETPDSTATQTQDEKEEVASSDVEGDTVKSEESTEDVTPPINTTE